MRIPIRSALRSARTEGIHPPLRGRRARAQSVGSRQINEPTMRRKYKHPARCAVELTLGSAGARRPLWPLRVTRFRPQRIPRTQARVPRAAWRTVGLTQRTENLDELSAASANARAGRVGSPARLRISLSIASMQLARRARPAAARSLVVNPSWTRSTMCAIGRSRSRASSTARLHNLGGYLAPSRDHL